MSAIAAIPDLPRNTHTSPPRSFIRVGRVRGTLRTAQAGYQQLRKPRIGISSRASANVRFGPVTRSGSGRFDPSEGEVLDVGVSV